MFELNGIKWDVKVVPKHSPQLQRSDGVYVLGVCDTRNGIIYLSADLNGDLMKKVVCHEVVHAAIYSYGVELSVEQEEVVAGLIASLGEEIIEIAKNIFDGLRKYTKGEIVADIKW